MTLNKYQLSLLLLICTVIGFGLGLGFQLWRTPTYAMSTETIQDSLGHRHIDTTYYIPHPAKNEYQSEQAGEYVGTPWHE